MANKLLILLAVAAALAGGYAAGGGGSFGTGGGTAPGKGEPEQCRMLMRRFIEEARKEDARRPNRQVTWAYIGGAAVKLHRIEAVLRRNGCPYLIDEQTGKGAPYRIGLPGEQPGPGVFVMPQHR